MKREIRGLRAGKYTDDCNGCALIVFKDDKGTHIISGDLEMDIYHHWIIDENGNKELIIGSPFELETT